MRGNTNPFGRGFHSRQFPQRHYASAGNVPRAVSPPVGPLLHHVNAEDLLSIARDENIAGAKMRISDCEYVASYNWLERDRPTIVVPGSPPTWTPLTEPRRLHEDQGTYFRDPNAARFPKYPTAPAVHALLAGDQGFATQEIDLFACSSTLGSLLRFVRHVDKPFRFFVETVGNTVFFIRRENSPTEVIPDVKGYGHTFPEAYTTWDADVKGSASHQRLLRYNFAGLDCIVRSSCDGYLEHKARSVVEMRSLNQSHSAGVKSGEDDLYATLDGIKLTYATTEQVTGNGQVKINLGGRMIPQEAVFDLKTRSARKQGLNVLEDELPRLWIAQIPNFILARHNSGVFDDIDVRHTSGDVQKWERGNQNDIARLSGLIRKIISIAKARGDSKLEVRCKTMATLELRSQDTDEHAVLPPELMARWMEGNVEEERSGGSPIFTGGVVLPNQEFSVASCRSFDSGEESGEESEKDYTACSADSCGYCGRCSY